MPTLTLRENPRMLEFRDLLYKYKDRIAAVLPRAVSMDKFAQWCMIALARDSKLLGCTAQSVFRSLNMAAQLGLDPTGVGGQAWVVPYKQTAQLLVGYKGLLDLARRTGIVVGVDAEVIHKNDAFRFQQGTHPRIIHRPVIDTDPGPMIGAYAILRLRGDTYPMQRVMRKAEIDAIRSSSRAGETGPWQTHYEAMARKTVLRQVLKLAPTSTELKVAEAAEERIEVEGENPDLSDLVPMPVLDDEPEPPMTKSEEVAQRIKEQGGADTPRS